MRKDIQPFPLRHFPLLRITNFRVCMLLGALSDAPDACGAFICVYVCVCRQEDERVNLVGFVYSPPTSRRCGSQIRYFALYCHVMCYSCGVYDMRLLWMAGLCARKATIFLIKLLNLISRSETYKTHKAHNTYIDACVYVFMCGSIF